MRGQGGTAYWPRFDLAVPRGLRASGQVRDTQRVHDGGPDFEALVHFCAECAGAGCDVCEELTFTPRTSKALYIALQTLADEVYDDAEEFGGGPLDPHTAAVLDLYPQFTWICDGAWRRRAARSYDDLAADMASGIRPLARCPAEEFAVLLAVERADGLVHDVPQFLDLDDLPVMASDYQWSTVLEELLMDLDIDFLLDPSLDGAEDPNSDFNQLIKMGDYRADKWFDISGDFLPRDPERGFRRPVSPA